MERIWFLPPEVTLKEAVSVWRSQEKGQLLAYAPHLTGKEGRRLEDSGVVGDLLTKVMKRAERGAHIIVWDARQMGEAEASVLLDIMKKKDITLRLLHPKLMLDASLPEAQTTMAFLARVQEGYVQKKGLARVKGRFGINPLEPKKVSAIRRDKHRGLSLKELVQKYEVAPGTIRKYTKDIKLVR